MAGQEVARGLRLFVQGSYALRSAFVQRVVVGASSVLLLVRLEDLARGLVQALGAVRQLGVGAAALFAGVGRQLDTVDGEHFFADQAQPVADQQYLGEQSLDVIAELTHKLGDVGVAGLAVAAEGDELHIISPRL